MSTAPLAPRIVLFLASAAFVLFSIAMVVSPTAVLPAGVPLDPPVPAIIHFGAIRTFALGAVTLVALARRAGACVLGYLAAARTIAELSDGLIGITENQANPWASAPLIVAAVLAWATWRLLRAAPATPA